MKHTRTLLVLFAGALFFPVFSQNWTTVQQWGGTGTEICTGLTTTKDGSVLLAGSFENEILFGSTLLKASGEEDIFLCKLQTNGEVAWAKRAGSQLEDEVAAIALDAEENLVVVGSYWLTSDFDTIQLTAGENPKAIFLAKYNSEGQTLWAKTLNGNGLKGVEAVVCDAENNILLTGYFEKNLQIGDTLLTARGATDLFLAKFTADGQFVWAVHQGKKGDTRGTALSLTSTGAPVVAGFYNDSTEIADTILTSGTLDQEAFIALFDQNGLPLWAKKAGGVFDSDVTALVLDEANNIYLTGYFVGVMRLSAELSIQSSSGNSDFFLLKYQSDGTPLAARALGGRQLDQALDLDMQNNILLVSGFYQGELNLDGFTLTSGNHLSGFVAGFDLNLQTKLLKNLASDAFLYAAQVAAEKTGKIWVGGSFIGNATLDHLQKQANSFDVLLAQLRFDATDVSEIPASAWFEVFPNPTQGQIFIRTDRNDYSIQVTNAQGERVFTSKNSKMIDGSAFPKGTYFVTFYGNFIPKTIQMVWQ